MSEDLHTEQQTEPKSEIKTFNPKSVGEEMEVLECLKSGKAAYVSLIGIEIETAQRCTDFLAGAVAALDGNLKYLGDGKFYVSPKSEQDSKIDEKEA